MTIEMFDNCGHSPAWPHPLQVAKEEACVKAARSMVQVGWEETSLSEAQAICVPGEAPQ